MGTDLLDLVLRLERDFDIRFAKGSSAMHLRRRETKKGYDAQVSDVVNWVKAQILAEHKEVPDTLMWRICMHLSDTLGVDIAQIKPESWLVQDLGME